MKISYTPRELRNVKNTFNNSTSVTSNNFYSFIDDNQKYIYDEVQISNISQSDIILTYNYSQNELIPSGSSRTINGQIRQISFKNNGTITININEVELICYQFSKENERISQLGSIAQILNLIK